MTTIDIFQLYQLTAATVNTQQGGHLRPERNFLAWVNEISKEIFNEKIQEWEKSQTVDDALAISFLRSVNVPIAKNAGRGFDVIAYPEDYSNFSSARVLVSDDSGKTCQEPKTDCMDCATGKITPYADPDDVELEILNRNSNYTEYNLDKIDNQRWGTALTHRLKAPTFKKPAITQFDGGFKIAPANLGVIVLDYFMRPVDAVFAYTVVNDQIIYDKNNSEQLQWTDMVIPEFVSRLKKRYASFVGDNDKYSQATVEQKQNS